MSITVGLTALKIERRISNAQQESFKSVAFETKDMALFLARYYRLLDRLNKAENKNMELQKRIRLLEQT